LHLAQWWILVRFFGEFFGDCKNIFEPTQEGPTNRPRYRHRSPSRDENAHQPMPDEMNLRKVGDSACGKINN
jgi:hypothetical protein